MALVVAGCPAGGAGTSAGNGGETDQIDDNKYSFTFKNEPRAEMVPDFAGNLLFVGNPELIMFTMNMTNSDGQSISMGFQKAEGPLPPGTYSPTVFSYVYEPGSICSPSHLAGQSVDVTFAGVEPVDASVSGTLTCKTGTPDEFTVDVNGTISE